MVGQTTDRSQKIFAEGQIKNLTILGATGSIGQQTLDIIRHHPEKFRVEALVANRNIEQLAKDAIEFRPDVVITADDMLLEELRQRLNGSDIDVQSGERAILEAAARPVDLVMAAIVGADGLKPTLAALEAGSKVALANKECLVCAGDIFMETARRNGLPVMPVDSEHNAVFQCLETHNSACVEKITLTASGGPFRKWKMEDMRKITREQALNHPNWSMGAKVTIDSATLMNKGLELIEAFHLFPVACDQLDAVVHPQSIVHSMVSYIDGSVLAQLGVPDMRTPIAGAMAWPDRVTAPVKALNLIEIGQLEFEPVDHNRFGAVKLALAALEKGGSAATILNAANEIAVSSFLNETIGFLSITALVEEVLNQADRENMLGSLASLDDVWQVDAYARCCAESLIKRGFTARKAGM